MSSAERNQLRQVFFEAWQKHVEKKPIEPIEGYIIDILLAHPEYQGLFENVDAFQDKDFGEENPFLHLSLHLALREQISADRPAGIKQIYRDLCHKLADVLVVEHRMMECLEGVLWEAQRTGIMPDEKKYLESLQKLNG